jgi:hypothetical protein
LIALDQSTRKDIVMFKILCLALWLLIRLVVAIFLIVKFIGLCEAVDRISRNTEAMSFDVKAIREQTAKEEEPKDEAKA